MGLKTAVRRLLEDRLGPDESARILGGANELVRAADGDVLVGQVALAFEESVVEVLVRKTVSAAEAVRGAVNHRDGRGGGECAAAGGDAGRDVGSTVHSSAGAVHG